MPRFATLQDHLPGLTRAASGGLSFEAALDNVPACVGYIDSKRLYRFVNARYEEVFGLPRDRIIGRAVEEVVGDEIYRAIDPIITRALEGHEGEFEAPFPTRTMGVRRGSFRYLPDFADNGQVVGYFAIVTDVTAAYDVSKVLQARESDIRRFSGDTPIMVAYCDADGRYRFINQVHANWFGLAPEAAIGKHWSKAVPPSDAVHIEPLLARAYLGERIEFLDEITLRDGKKRHMRAVYLPHVERKTVMGVFVIREDVTDIHAAVAALFAGDGRISLENDNIPASICYIDAEQRYRFVSRRHCEWSGRKASDIVGKTISDLLAPEFHEVLKPRIERALRGETIEFEDVMVMPSGPDLFSRVTYLPHVDDGRVKGMIVVRSEVHAFRRVEAELRHIASHDTLTGLVNRQSFRDRFAHVSSVVDRNSCALCLLLLKLDGLKAVHDLAGQRGGEHVLRAVAEHLRKSCGESNTAVRSGDDEFAILMDAGAGVEQAVSLAEKLAKAVKQPVTFGEDTFQVRANVGIAIVDRFAADVDQALHMANDAMLAARYLRKEYAVYGIYSSGKAAAKDAKAGGDARRAVAAAG